MLALVIAQGCATTTSVPDEGGDAARRWSGRFSAGWTLSGTPPRTERTSGRFTLTDTPALTTLEVYSPFGQTVAKAQSSPAGAALETSDGRRFEAGDPETLTETVLGWRIPMGRLPAWLSDAAPGSRVDHGWRVVVDAREADRPRTLSLDWPDGAATPDAPRVKIRLILDPEVDKTTQ